MERNVLALVGVSALVATVMACSSKTPATPAPPAPPSTSASDGSTLKATAPTPTSPINDAKLQSSTVVLSAGASTAQFSPGVPLQYRFQVFNAANTMVQDSGLVGGPTYQVAAQLVGNQRHTWRARAEYQGQPGPWSTTASFISPDPALINDPLTNGVTVGSMGGGHFIPGQGWQSDSSTSFINYDIPTCDNCTIDFDITNIGKGEGTCCNADLIFVSMGEASSFDGGFGPFRDGPYKMHFKQRADGDGTGSDMVWRNGGVGDSNPGDHRIKLVCCGPDYRNTSVFHFKLKWSPSGYSVQFSQDGGPLQDLMSDGFGGIPYAPGQHRISLGCYPRGESFVGIIYRNFKLTKN
jgi:hypothetical protein